MATDVIVRPAGARAVLLELDNLEQVAAWREAVAGLVAGSLLASPADVVPGARTLLLDGVDPAAVRRALAGLGTPAAVVDRPDAPPVEVPVVYDGADLAEVAQLWGVSEREVVARHTGTQFRVAFCGFAPGFPYLVGLDRQVPRRPTPRPSVPAGSVGLAGRYCGIYPTSSPGGWQLLGTTAVPLFDVAVSAFETADPALAAGAPLHCFAERWPVFLGLSGLAGFALAGNHDVPDTRSCSASSTLFSP